jgi:hypothetical protein
MEATRKDTGEKVKVSKKVLEAQELYKEQMLRISQYSNIGKIADSPLPKHKRRVWDEITARYWVRATQAEANFRKAFDKLNEKNRRILIDIRRGELVL